MMRVGKFFALPGMLAFLLCLTACGDGGSARRQSLSDGRFYLLDYRTQMPVMSCTVPPDWLAGGKTVWSGDPALPVTWYVWFMSPDRRTRMIFNSQNGIPALGRIQQVPVLRDPALLPGRLRPSLERDYGVEKMRLTEARFVARPVDPGLLQSRQMQAHQRGIRLVNYLFTELAACYEGYRGSEKYQVVLSVPMLALESQVSMSFTTMVELLFPMSFLCPDGQEEAARRMQESILKSFQFNPNFVTTVNQISAQRTANWLAVQNQIRERQLEAASSTSATLDRVRDKWSEYIRDVDPVTNPNTGEKMFVDSRYDHAWINSENEIIYHNNGFNTPHSSTATFDPNSDALFHHTSWRKLK